MELLTLDEKGVVVAIAMAAGFVVLGWGLSYFFIGVMLLFLALSAIVTHIGMDYKKKRQLGQDPRSISNVLANGLPPLFMAFLYRIALLFGANAIAIIFLVGFVASAAAITADKFGSEIGVLDGVPFSVIGLKHVKKGTSGAVTWVGLVVSLLAALLVAFPILIFAQIHTILGISGLALVGIIGISGFLGGFIDSLLGYYEEKGIGNKYTSNAICSIGGAIIAIATVIMLVH